MIQVDLDHTTKHLDPDFERKVREAKLACKEAAGWRCEYIYPNGKRCSATEGQLKRKKGRNGRPDGWSVVHMHGCHADQDRLNPQPRLICLCPRHHIEFDRHAELKEQVKQYRRGYQLTSTDALISHLKFTGIDIVEGSDGYHWTIDGTDMQGHRNTAIHAVGAAIYQLRSLYGQAQETIQRLQQQLEGEKYARQGHYSDTKEEDTMTEGMPRCECDNLLRSKTEQRRGYCFECGITQALLQQKSKHQATTTESKIAEATVSAK